MTDNMPIGEQNVTLSSTNTEAPVTTTITSGTTTSAPAVTPAQTNAPASTGSNELEHLQKSYQGLQKSYQQLYDKHNQVTAEHTNVVAQQEAIKAERDNLSGQLSAAQTQLQQTQQDLMRARLIMQDFGDLALFESQGLLPSATDETDLRAKLLKFRESVGTVVAGGVQQKLAGSTPAGSGATSATTSNQEYDEDYIWQQMSIHAGRNTQEFVKWQRLWDAAQQRKQSK